MKLIKKCTFIFLYGYFEHLVRTLKPCTVGCLVANHYSMCGSSFTIMEDDGYALPE